MLSLAVVGAGVMGTNHARLSAGLRDAELRYVVDSDPVRAERLAGGTGTKWGTCIDDALDEIDAAVVAVPTELHHQVALRLIRAGKHVLIEKPLAATVDQAEEIVEAADAAGLTVLVGHVERYNPAVLGLDHVLDDVVHIHAARISPYAPRVRDGVILDLMIHDLDIARTVARSEVADVQAAARRVRSTTEDIATAILTFENGVTADIVASRVGQQKIRELGITQADNYVAVDLLRQDVTISRVEHEEYVSSEGTRYRQTGIVEIPFLEHRGEPVLLEMQDFVSAVTTGRPPRVTARDGLETLRLAHRVARVARRS